MLRGREDGRRLRRRRSSARARTRCRRNRSMQIWRNALAKECRPLAHLRAAHRTSHLLRGPNREIFHPMRTPHRRHQMAPLWEHTKAQLADHEIFPPMLIANNVIGPKSEKHHRSHPRMTPTVRVVRVPDGQSRWVSKMTGRNPMRAALTKTPLE